MGIRKCVCRTVGRMMSEATSMARELMPRAIVVGAGSMLMPPAGGLRVDLREERDDVVVVADLPGVEKENIAVRLLSPTELEITGARCSERPETAEGGEFVYRERTCDRMDRVVSFPSDATAEGATASYENGVLTVRLRKAEVYRGERIPID
jgi:HSP20 family protein